MAKNAASRVQRRAMTKSPVRLRCNGSAKRMRRMAIQEAGGKIRRVKAK